MTSEIGTQAALICRRRYLLFALANTSDDNFGCITSFFLATLVGIMLTVGAVIGWKVAGIVVAVILVVGFALPTVITLLTWVRKFYVRHGTDRGRK